MTAITYLLGFEMIYAVQNNLSCRFNDPVINAVMLILQIIPALMNVWPFSRYNRKIVDDLQASLGE